MKYIFAIIIFLYCSSLYSQGRWDRTWVTSSNTLAFNSTVIDFNDNPILIDSIRYRAGFSRYAAFISSYSTGELLMYTNGCEVMNREGAFITNGEVINLLSDYTTGTCLSAKDTSKTGHIGWMQEMIFIPLDTLDEEFLLIYYPYKKIVEFPFIAIKQLVSSRIKKNSQNKYEIITKDKVLTEVENMAAASLNLVKIPGQKLAWWLFCADDITNIYYRLYVSKDSISPVTKMIIKEIVPDDANGVCSKFSPNGNLYAKVEVPVDSSANWIYLFDLDRTTGELNYNQNWRLPNELSLGSGLEFSASGRFLYVTRHLQVYQYDLWAADIPASVEIVAEWDGFQELGFIGNFFYPQRAPDCRIYINSTNSLKYYHYINHPEVKGKGCDVRQHALELVEWHAGSIPFFPNYRLDYTCPVCDSTLELPIEVSSEDVPISKAYFKVFPNPFVDEITISMMVGNAMPESEMVLMDLNGKELITEKAYGRDQFTMNASNLPSGMYILQFRQQGKVIQVDKVVKIE